MKTDRSTGLIQIIKTPTGEAPLNLRHAWVGKILPCDPYLGYPDCGLDRGVLSDKKVSRNQSGFSVPQDQAIAILEKHNPQAARGWRDLGFPQPNGYFGFTEDEAQIISGVTQQKIIHVTDEMMGHPTR